MKSGGFDCCGDISQGNTLVWWSVLIDRRLRDEPIHAYIYVVSDDFGLARSLSQSVTTRPIFPF